MKSQPSMRDDSTKKSGILVDAGTHFLRIDSATTIKTVMLNIQLRLCAWLIRTLCSGMLHQYCRMCPAGCSFRSERTTIHRATVASRVCLLRRQDHGVRLQIMSHLKNWRLRNRRSRLPAETLFCDACFEPGVHLHRIRVNFVSSERQS